MNFLIEETIYDGVVELAVVAWPCVQPLVTDLKPLLHFHEPVPFVVPRRHPFATRPGVTQSEISLSESRFLLLRWWQLTPPEVARLAAQARYATDVPREIALHLACEGHAHGFFTQMYVTRALKEGALLEIPVTDLRPLYRDSALVCLERRANLSPAATALVQYIREHAARLGLLTER